MRPGAAVGDVPGLKLAVLCLRSCVLRLAATPVGPTGLWRSGISSGKSSRLKLKPFENQQLKKLMPKSVLLLGALACAVMPTVSRAETLTAIPMQGEMVMPMLSYHANDARLHVMPDPTVPQLTPLLVSHPGDSFDPADPWFDALDPSRQGRSFSRRYGFVMASMTDPLPPGTQIWIRKLSGSPELAAYRYANTDPKLFQPIFGTEGVTNALYWNGMMFHPVFTAPPGTNTSTATFEAYLLDTGSGLEVPNSSTGPFVLDFTNVPDGRPELGIGQRVVILWPANTTGWQLEGAATLPNGDWTPVTNAPVFVEGQSAVVLEPGDPRKFFRMKLQP